MTKRADPFDTLDNLATKLLGDRGLLVEALLDLVRQVMAADLDTEEDRIIFPGLAVAMDTARAALREVLGS